LYVFEGKPLLLPNFVCDQYFVAKVSKQYRTWSSFFEKKRKRQFISLPFNEANIKIKILLHFSKVSEMLNVFHLKEVEPFKGFDPEGLFSSHLLSL
jgi:hypothetical protein